MLGTLAVATIAMPMSGAANEGFEIQPDAPEGETGPSALQFVTRQAATAEVSANVAAAPKLTGRTEAASRSVDRGPLPNCDTAVRPTGTNGKLDTHELCELWQGGESLRPDAAVALTAMNQAFRSRFGRDMCLVSSYRTLSTQVSLKSTRGGFAAPPGMSMHGWGLAIDLCSKETGDSAVYSWINANGPTYGWANPAWAKRGGKGAYEPWHFEFTKGVTEVGGDW